jgi:hypothetical protein
MAYHHKIKKKEEEVKPGQFLLAGCNHNCATCPFHVAPQSFAEWGYVALHEWAWVSLLIGWRPMSRPLCVNMLNCFINKKLSFMLDLNSQGIFFVSLFVITCVILYVSLWKGVFP